jgi:hypothetical protein
MLDVARFTCAAGKPPSVTMALLPRVLAASLNVTTEIDCVAEDAVHREPVSPCNFGKSGLICKKCREGRTNLGQKLRNLNPLAAISLFWEQGDYNFLAGRIANRTSMLYAPEQREEQLHIDGGGVGERIRSEWLYFDT